MTSAPSSAPTAERPAPVAALGSSDTERRTLRFESLAEMLADVESLAAGPVSATGQWTPAQVIDHVRRVIHVSHAGTDLRFPLPIRLFGRLLKGRAIAKPFNPGIKIPKSAADVFAPPADVDWDEAVAAFREDVLAASRPGAMNHPSPLFGKMTHTEWEALHCRHAELHFSFLHPGTA